jgi:hypothetical protein
MSSNLIERRDFLAMGLAFGTIAATAPPAFAQPAKEPKLTLHVLDVYSGKPAARVKVDLSVLAGENYQHLKSSEYCGEWPQRAAAACRPGNQGRWL